MKLEDPMSLSQPNDDSSPDRTPAWWYIAAVVVGVLATAFTMGGSEKFAAPQRAIADPAAPATNKEWAVPAMPAVTMTPAPAAPAAAEEDGEFIVDPSVAAAEEEERTADPYEINEALVMPDETGRVQPSYADIVTAAEEEPEVPKESGTEENSATR